MVRHWLKLTKALVKFICAVFYAALWHLLGKGPSRVVLLYHSVDKVQLPLFRKQMAYLARKCEVVKPSQIMTARPAKGKPVVALTFDDGLLSVLENGLPVLKEYGLPSAIFVPTGNLGRRPCWDLYSDCHDVDENVMTESQIAALDREGIEVSSHTVSHPVLPDLDDAALENELVASRTRLEEILGHEVSGISYPYGACDARVYQAAQKAGYKTGFTVESAKVDDRTDALRIGRVEVSPDEPFLQFKLKVDGAYYVACYLRKFRAILLIS